jgi:hypothetical protein
MDIQVITSLIGSLGFPIVCCVALFVQLQKSGERHKEEIAKLSEAINNNTSVMTELINKLENK